MNINFRKDDRHVIPRWRDFKTTSKLSELGNPVRFKKDYVNQEKIPGFLDKKRYDWLVNKGLAFATDFVGSAFIAGKLDYAKDAALFILENCENNTDLAVKQAKIVLGIKTEGNIRKTEDVDQILEKKNLGSNIGLLKKKLQIDQYNGIIWVDLAREYVIIGKPDKAYRCMQTALQLAPDNRFILRSASRLFMHLNKYDQAHYILKKAARLKYDPWLLASEISVASAIEKSSGNLKFGQGLIESQDFDDSDLTELSSEIGTIELGWGSIKSAKKLFRKSLIDPNDNSFAQAAWVNGHFPALDLPEKGIQVPCSFEALAIQNVFMQKWDDALNEVLQWLNDMPFSSRPVSLASYIASTALEDFDLSIKILEYGMIANPKDNLLLNNLTFALLNKGETQKAEEIFSNIHMGEDSEFDSIIYLATKGLIFFKKGLFDEGRKLYHQAIENSLKSNDKCIKAKASIYLAIEEINARTEFARTAFEAAVKHTGIPEDPYLKVLLKRLIKTYASAYNVPNADEIMGRLNIF